MEKISITTGRILLGLYFLYSGITKILKLPVKQLLVEEKYLKFYNKFISHSKTVSDSGVIYNSKLTGDNYGNKFLHLVNSDDCGDSIFLDFDRKMGKEKRYETTIPQKLIERTFEAKED